MNNLRWVIRFNKRLGKHETVLQEYCEVCGIDFEWKDVPTINGPDKE